MACSIRQFNTLLLFVATILTIGCGDGRPQRVTISGQVLIDGQPLKYGSIRFVPKNGRPSFGALDKEGRFTMTCFDEHDGVILGTHRVEVSGCESLGPTKTKWHAPKKYSSYTTSPIEQEITGSNDALVIQLSWEGGKPFTETFEGGGTDRPRFGEHAGK
jgi:hypothetical protein